MGLSDPTAFMISPTEMFPTLHTSYARALGGVDERDDQSIDHMIQHNGEHDARLSKGFFGEERMPARDEKEYEDDEESVDTAKE